MVFNRKLLPTVPDMDTQLSLSAKMIDKRTSTPRGNHSYGPFFLEYSLLAEYNLLQKQKMPGVYVIPSEHSSLGNDQHFMNAIQYDILFNFLIVYFHSFYNPIKNVASIEEKTCWDVVLMIRTRGRMIFKRRDSVSYFTSCSL